jgi:deoxyadenosine/deoxycytidine kinase
MAKPYITICGPVGAGKSTFAAYLSKQLGYPFFLESAGERNPFLELFYKDREQYAFRSQAFFLLEALQQQQTINDLSDGAIQDRSYWEHMAIFVDSLVQDNLISNDEHQLLQSIAEIGGYSLSNPELMIYLQSTPKLLKQRILGRGRSYEQKITETDLEKTIASYQQWIEHWPGNKVVIDSSTIDYDDQQQMNKILTVVKQSLSNG